MSFSRVLPYTVARSLQSEPLWSALDKNKGGNNIKSTIKSPGAVETELYTTISDQKAAERLHQAQKEWGLSADDIAQAVAYVIDTPDRVSVSDINIRPTKQEVEINYSQKRRHIEKWI